MNDRRIWQAAALSGVLLVGVGVMQGELETAVAGGLVPVAAALGADYYGLGDTWRDVDVPDERNGDGARADVDGRGLRYGGDDLRGGGS